MKIVGQRPEPEPEIWRDDAIWRGVRLTCEACGAILEMEGWRDFESVLPHNKPFVAPLASKTVIRALVPCARCHQTIDVVREVLNHQ